MPERGISLPLTDEDVAGGIDMLYYMSSADLFPTLPLFVVSYVDQDAMDAVRAKYSDADLEDDDVYMEMMMEVYAHEHTLYEVLLFETETFNNALASGATIESLIGIEELPGDFSKLAENAKVALRNLRREANDKIKDMKKKSEMTEDEEKASNKLIQDLTDKYVKMVEEICAKKKAEIMSI